MLLTRKSRRWSSSRRLLTVKVVLSVRPVDKLRAKELEIIKQEVMKEQKVRKK
jgi:hypothetical protein